MEDATDQNLKIFKNTYRTVIPSLPPLLPSLSTSTHGYTAPSLPTSRVMINKVEIIFDASLPKSLLQGLDRYVEGLKEDQLQGKAVQQAKKDKENAMENLGRLAIYNEGSVLPAFLLVLGLPVTSLCLAIGVSVSYRGGPTVHNILPDHAFVMNEQPITIFEHKSPWVADKHFPEIVALAKRGDPLDLSENSEGAPSILCKLVMAVIEKELEYAVVHSMKDFVFIRVIRGTQANQYRAFISGIVPLTESTTPIMPLILALLLHARKDGYALKYKPTELSTSISGNIELDLGEHSVERAAGTGSPRMSSDQQSNTIGLDPPVESQLDSPDSASLLEYWEPNDMDPETLAQLLKNMDGLSMYWAMKAFTRDIYRPLRRHDSLIWAQPVPSQPTSRVVVHTIGSLQITPPPSPPLTPFVLRIEDEIGRGAVGTAYRGVFPGVSVPVIVKILPVECMDRELEIWRRLRHLAGITIPGLYGAYALDNKIRRAPTGALVQQYAGTAPASFGDLSSDQRLVLYRIVTQIHDAQVKHGDLRSSNVAVRDDGQVMVFDFSHACHHKCPGGTSCGELQQLRLELELPDQA